MTPASGSHIKSEPDQVSSPSHTDGDCHRWVLYGSSSTVMPAPGSRIESESDMASMSPEEGEDEQEESDDDDDDDEEQSSSSHAQEVLLPPCAAYDSDTINLSHCAQSLVSEFYQTLGQARPSSKDVETMASKAANLMTVPTAPKKTIMLLGDTGTGKSSTINSLVNDPDATKAAATGESCTCVPTLLVSSLTDQHRQYAAELCFMSYDTRKSFLTEQTQRYFRYNFAFDPEWPEDQRQDYEAQADTALKVLRALFCDQFEFSSPGNIKRTFQEHVQDVTAVVDILTKWCITLLEGCHDHTTLPTMRFDADSSVELSEMIQPYIFEQNDLEQPALWPLIDHVRKGILSSPMLEFLNILDLPGTADTDRVRGEIANKFIKDSDGLWLVTTVGRPLSDEPLNKKLATYGERFGSNVAIIATRSDTGADDNLARDLAEKGAQPSTVAEYWKQSAQIKDLTAAISSIDHKLKRPRGKKRQKTLSDAEETTLYREKAKLEDALQETRNAQLDGLVDMRNSRISARLKETKKKYLSKGAELEVFCVSNKHYMAHKGIETAETRCMSVEMTNIPALRRCALRMVAPDRFITIDTYISTALTLVRGASLWADATIVEHRATLMRIARQPIALLDIFLNQWLETAAKQCDSDLISPLTANQDDFIKSALRVHQEIQQWHPSSIRAFFAKNGNHSTQKQKHQIWNEKFSETQTALLESHWYPFLHQQKTSLRNGLKKIFHALNDIPDQLCTLPAAIPIPLEPLQALIASCINRFRALQKRHLIAFDKFTSNIKLDSTRDIPTGYFTQAMYPLYEACNSDREGRGITKRQLGALRNHLLLGDRNNNNDKSSSSKNPKSSRKAKSTKPKNPFTALPTNLTHYVLSVAMTSLVEKIRREMMGILEELVEMFDWAVVVIDNNNNNREQEEEEDDDDDDGSQQQQQQQHARVIVKDFMARKKSEMERMEKDLRGVKRKYGILDGD